MELTPDERYVVRYLKRSKRARELQLVAREFQQYMAKSARKYSHYLIAELEAEAAYLDFVDREESRRAQEEEDERERRYYDAFYEDYERDDAFYDYDDYPSVIETWTNDPNLLG